MTYSCFNRLLKANLRNYACMGAVCLSCLLVLFPFSKSFAQKTDIEDIEELLDAYFDENDYNKSKEKLWKCIEACQGRSDDMDMDMDYLQNLYESYPDFYTVQERDTCYYHILNDEEVSLVFFVHGDKNRTEVNVAETVNYNDKTYTVTKIGMNAFGGLKYWLSAEAFTPVLGVFRQNSPFPARANWDENSDFVGTDSLTRITLPNTVTYIGYGAFMNMLEPRCLEVNIPQNIKTIQTFAFLGCKHGNTVTIPEGAVSVGVAWNAEALRLELPSTLERLDDFDSHTFISRDYLRFSEIKIHPANTHLKAVNNVVFKADGTKLYPLSMKQVGEGCDLFIPKNLYVKDWTDINSMLLPNSISVEDGCKNYKLYQGALYNQALDTLILCPKNVENLVLPPTFRSESSPYNFSNCKSLYFPREVPPAVFWNSLSFVFDDDLNITYEAVNDQKAMDECIQLAEKESDENILPTLNFYKMLRKNGDKKHAKAIRKIIKSKGMKL